MLILIYYCTKLFNNVFETRWVFFLLSRTYAAATVLKHVNFPQSFPDTISLFWTESRISAIYKGVSLSYGVVFVLRRPCRNGGDIETGGLYFARCSYLGTLIIEAPERPEENIHLERASSCETFKQNSSELVPRGWPYPIYAIYNVRSPWAVGLEMKKINPEPFNSYLCYALETFNID